MYAQAGFIGADLLRHQSDISASHYSSLKTHKVIYTPVAPVTAAVAQVKKGNGSPQPLHPQHVSHAPCLSLESRESLACRPGRVLSTDNVAIIKIPPSAPQHQKYRERVYRQD